MGVYTFFDLPFLVNIAVDVVCVMLCIPCQVQIQLHHGFPHPIPSQLGCIPLLFLGYLSWDRVEGCIYVLPFSLTSSLFSSLLESCLLCLISCAWRSLALVLYGGHPYRCASLLLSLVPEGSFPGVCTGLLQRPNFTAHLIHIPLDCRLHQCVITVAQVKV